MNYSDANIQKRINYIDVLKGISIILVLLGHRGFNEYVVQIIYFFHMPIFFFISGYLDKMERKPLRDIAIKKAKRLLYPYIVFNILIIAYNSLFDLLKGEASALKLGKRLVAFIYGNYIWENNIEYIGTLWFLVGLFFSIIFANIIYRFCNQSKMSLLMSVFLLVSIGWICSYIKSRWGYRLPWCMDVAFVGAVFYLVGVYWKRWKKREKCERISVGIVFLVLGIVTGSLNLLFMQHNGYTVVRSDMLMMNYGFLPIFVVSASFMSIGLMIIIKKLCEMFTIPLLGHIGELSMLLMIDHLYIYQVFDIILNKLGMNRWIIFFPVTMIISIICAETVYRYIPVLYDSSKLQFKNNK